MRRMITGRGRDEDFARPASASCREGQSSATCTLERCTASVASLFALFAQHADAGSVASFNVPHTKAVTMAARFEVRRQVSFSNLQFLCRFIVAWRSLKLHGERNLGKGQSFTDFVLSALLGQFRASSRGSVRLEKRREDRTVPKTCRRPVRRVGRHRHGAEDDGAMALVMNNIKEVVAVERWSSAVGFSPQVISRASDSARVAKQRRRRSSPPTLAQREIDIAAKFEYNEHHRLVITDCHLDFLSRVA